MDEAHDAEHELEVLVFGVGGASSSAAGGLVVALELLGPLAELVGPVFRLVDGEEGLVALEALAEVVEREVDLGLAHRVEELAVFLLGGAGEEVAEVLLDPTDVGGGLGLLADERVGAALVGGVEFLAGQAEDAFEGLDEAGGDAVLFAGGLLEPVDEGAGLELAVGLVGLVDCLLQFLDRVALAFDGVAHVLVGLFLGAAGVAGLAEFLFDRGQVLAAEFLHRLERAGHLLERVLVDLAVAGGVLEQLLGGVGELAHAFGAFAFGVLLVAQAFAVQFVLELLAVEAVEALVFVELVEFAAGEVLEFADDAVELALEQLGVLVAGEDEQGDRLGVGAAAAGQVVLGERAQEEFLGFDAECAG